MILTLTPGERQSGAWRKLMEHCTNELNVLRAQNDGKLDAHDTDTLRGRIAAYKELIAADQEPPMVEEQPVTRT